MTTAIMFYCNRPFHDFCQLLTAAEFYRRLYGGGGAFNVSSLSLIGFVILRRVFPALSMGIRLLVFIKKLEKNVEESI